MPSFGRAQEPDEPAKYGGQIPDYLEDLKNFLHKPIPEVGDVATIVSIGDDGHPRWKASSGSGGVGISAHGDRQESEINPTFTHACDGSSQTFTIGDLSSPPTWLDSTGAIIHPGIYQAQVITGLMSSLTDPVGKFVRVHSPFGMVLDMSMEPMQTLGATQMNDVGALADVDVTDGGWNTQVLVYLPTDDTGVMFFTFILVRLAH